MLVLIKIIVCSGGVGVVIDVIACCFVGFPLFILARSLSLYRSRDLSLQVERSMLAASLDVVHAIHPAVQLLHNSPAATVLDLVP